MNERGEDMTPEEFDAALAKGEPVEITTPPEGIRVIALPEVPPGCTMECGDGYIYTHEGRSPKLWNTTGARYVNGFPLNPQVRDV